MKRIQEYNTLKDHAIKEQLFHPFNEHTRYSQAYLFYIAVDVPVSPDHFPLRCIGIDTSVAPTYEQWTAQGSTPHLVDITHCGQEPELREVYVKLFGDVNPPSDQIKDLNMNFGLSELKRLWSNLGITFGGHLRGQQEVRKL